MSQHLTDDEMREALQTCADEPAHVPGTIQPVGYLLACDVEEGRFHQVSENCADLFDRPAEDLLSEDVTSLLGWEIWHAVRNAIGMDAFGKARRYVGRYEHKETVYIIHATKAGVRCILEIEPFVAPEEEPDHLARDRAYLIQQIEDCNTLSELFETTVEFLKYLTGFDRVSIIEFDDQWNGAVVSEACNALVDPILGLRFPSHDIPPQARELMRITPFRIISDVSQKPVPLLARNAGEPALDMTNAVLRGVSPVHMQYLQNFGVSATMTLSIILNEQLWGYISFHNTTPKVAPPDIRQMLLNFMPVLRLKLGLIRREQDIRLSRQIDALQADVKDELERGSDLQDMLDRVGPSIVEVLDAVGVAMTNGSEYFVLVEVPETAVIAALSAKANAHPSHELAETGLAEAFPDLAPRLDGFAGALVTVYEDDRCLQVFRREIATTIHWAGNPSKTVEVVDNALRIQPRNSFSSYLEEAKGRCKSWSRDDVHLMRQLWPLLSAAERRAFMADLNRQQTLMINELNHRVRNILSLVKSVSTQARRVGGALESYSQALEARIHALAAAHDIGAGAAQTSVSIRQIIQLEAEPYVKDEADRVRVSGDDGHVRAEFAPILALVIHELMTNAVKYGALSVPDAHIDIQLRRSDDGIRVFWTERDGPVAREPNAYGFGTTLIQQAVPYEMGGKAELSFTPSGVEAQLDLPLSALSDAGEPQVTDEARAADVSATDLALSQNGLVLVLEDNFVIAKDMRGRLTDAGYTNVEMLPNAVRAKALLDKTTPVLAVLDVNLGHGETSVEIANELLSRRIPFFFVTGYGEAHSLPPHLSDVLVLTKPVTTRDVSRALASLAETGTSI